LDGKQGQVREINFVTRFTTTFCFITGQFTSMTIFVFARAVLFEVLHIVVLTTAPETVTSGGSERVCQRSFLESGAKFRM